MEFTKEELHDIIATFILRDLENQGVKHQVTDDAFIFEDEEDAEMFVERAKEMGYDKWLFEDEEPTLERVE